jgi:hypothetical protein
VLCELEAYSGVQFHRVLNPDLYNKKVRVFDDTYPEEFKKQAKIGRNIAKKKKIVFAGLMRNIENNVKAVVKKLKFIGKHFKNYKIVLFENDSTDDTRKIVKKQALKNKNIILLGCDHLGSRECILKQKHGYVLGWNSENRYVRMAKYREEYVNYIKKHLTDYDYVMVFDMDIDGAISIDGLMMSIAKDDFGAIYGNGQCSPYGTFGSYPITYDIIAYVDINEPYPTENKLGVTNIVTNAFRMNYGKSMKDGFIPVRSAFNGFALYKMDAFVKGSYLGVPVCEHINFAKKLDDNGFKQYINYAWIVHLKTQGAGGPFTLAHQYIFL